MEIPAQTPLPGLVSATIPTRLPTPIRLAVLVAAICSGATTIRLKASLVRTRIKISRSRFLVVLLAQVPHSPSQQLGSLVIPILPTPILGCSGTITPGHSLREDSSVVLAAQIKHPLCSAETPTRLKSHSSAVATPIPIPDSLEIRRASLRPLASSAITPTNSRTSHSKVLCLEVTTITILGPGSLET